MIHAKEPTAVLTAIVIAIAALGTCAYVVIVRIQAVGDAIAAQQEGVTVQTADWTTYESAAYGFTVRYPAAWQLDDSGLAADVPWVAIGNPLTGTKTYVVRISIMNNTSSLSSGEYVHAMLAADRAADAASGADKNRAPATTPQFERTELGYVGLTETYELYGVFEFDHRAEQVYVAHEGEVLRFDFPIPQENPNISLPVANSQTAHQIVDTLTFSG